MQNHSHTMLTLQDASNYVRDNEWASSTSPRQVGDQESVTGQPVTYMDDRSHPPSPVTADQMDQLKDGGCTLTSYKIF